MTDKDTITLPREVAYQVPLHELLAAVPADARLVIDDADGKGTRFIPVGRLCREAATALAAEQPKPEPVAWQERHFFPKVGEWTGWSDCRPRIADYPREQTEQNGVTYQWRPLYAAPPALAAEKRHPDYVIGNHWFETAYERLCAGEAEDAILEDYELVREPRLRDLRRDAERYRWLRDKAPPDIGDMASVRDSHDPSEIDAAIDAEMEEKR